MTWLQSIIIAVLTGSLGLICGAIVMAGCAYWHNISHFEGKADFAIVGVALLGGIAAFIVGLVTARVVAAGVSPTFINGLGTAAGIVVGFSALAAGLGWLTGDPTPRIEAAKQAGDEPVFHDYEAAKIEAEQAAFEAIPDGAPIEAWLECTKYGATKERYAVVLRRVTAKTGWEVELAALMMNQDPRLSETAMRFVQELPHPPPGLVAAVNAAGRDLAERIRQFNATTVEQDPRYQGAGDASLRFSGWMAAARALREKCGGDFVPELCEILELSRVRNDSSVMRTDIRRVASYYAKEWAGLEPLPGDPPPR